MTMVALWEELKLDIVVLSCYAPGHSRFNPIEKSWSRLTSLISTAILPTDIDGVVPKPGTPEWVTVLDQAAEHCVKFWDGKSYCGKSISAKCLKGSDASTEKMRCNHKNLAAFIDSSKEDKIISRAARNAKEIQVLCRPLYKETLPVRIFKMFKYLMQTLYLHKTKRKQFA